MKLETFATLAAVIEEGSFAAAAATMHLTPSAVSMQMKQLEQYLGQPLFDRSGLQVRPNALAREVAASMEGGLRHLNALRRRASVAVEGVVRLGVIESIQPVLLPGTLLYLRERYPRLTVRPVRGKQRGTHGNGQGGPARCGGRGASRVGTHGEPALVSRGDARTAAGRAAR